MNNPVTNHPVMFLVNAMCGGGNPGQLLMNMAQQDPRAKQVVQILGNKSPGQQREIVQNMARERGIDLDDLARSLGVSIPSNR